MPDVEHPEQGRYDARVGEDVLVRLPQNASTGYVWSLVSLGDGLALVDDLVQAARPTDLEMTPAPGASSERVFRLRAVGPGVWPVHLRLARPWEAAPLEERRLTISVT